MSRFNNPGGIIYPTQGFPFGAQAPIVQTRVPGSMTPPPVVPPGADPFSAPTSGGGSVVPSTPGAVQTPDTSYWQGSVALTFSPFTAGILPSAIAQPLPAPVNIAVWSTPVFDLRPNLVSSPQQSTGQPLSRGSKAEIAFKLQFRPPSGGGLLPLRVFNVYALEQGDPFQPTNLSPLIGLEPVSSLMSTAAAVTPGGRIAEAVFTPPPGVRFWQVTLVICQQTPAATLGPVDVWASAY